MISFLKGEIHSLKPTHLELNVNGVGYDLSISINAYESFIEQKELFVFTYLSISENYHQLFGFYSIDEKDLFTKLISVNGVGPKVALNVLSGATVSEISSAIVNQDLLLLKKINGIGSKTAERIILELRDKIQLLQNVNGKTSSENKDISSKKSFGINVTENEATLALISLGYKKNLVEKIVHKLMKEDPFLKLEELIKLSLKQF
jgi:holliday junction DNA helicase RuvA